MTHDLYSLLRGPLVWIAFGVFAAGMAFRLISMARLARQKDRVVFDYMSARYALRSILHWMVPFAGVNMRRHPVMTAIAFVFHALLLAAPIFLCAHVLLINESWSLSWWFLPDGLADLFTLGVIAACLFFLSRRIFRPEVRYLTTLSDFVILFLVAAPFISGFWAYHQWPNYPLAMMLHILSGEILLAVIPFTRLSHMFFFPFTRGYMGSEFGGVRHAKDW
ncbi:MAG: respiratory nitrate reductase subunit gamma [Desulfosalsimonadaceae bacterium]